MCRELSQSAHTLLVNPRTFLSTLGTAPAKEILRLNSDQIEDTMKCNSCWQELKGLALATTCGHIFCIEDANNLLRNNSTCPLCEVLLSKSNMKDVDMAPSEEWINVYISNGMLQMVMVGLAPEIIMECASKGVCFWIGQRDVEVQLSIKKALHFQQILEQTEASYRRKNVEMEDAYAKKLEEAQAEYQKAISSFQTKDSERESLLGDNKELQEKYAEKSRQQRKLEETYTALRKEYEHIEQSAATPRYSKEATPQHPNLFAFEGHRFQSSSTSGMAPCTPVGIGQFWPKSQADRSDSIFLPNLDKPLRGRPKASASFQKPTSGGSQNNLNACSVFKTSGSRQG